MEAALAAYLRLGARKPPGASEGASLLVLGGPADAGVVVEVVGEVREDLRVPNVGYRPMGLKAYR